MMGTITTKANSANSKLVDTLEMTDNTSLSIYDGTTVKGESVTNAIKNVKQIGSGIKLHITVKTKDGTTAHYGYDDSTYKETPKTDIPDLGEEGYINPSGNFSSELDPDENDVVKGIIFTQK